jgi:hypothetical protein
MGDGWLKVYMFVARLLGKLLLPGNVTFQRLDEACLLHGALWLRLRPSYSNQLT